MKRTFLKKWNGHSFTFHWTSYLVLETHARINRAAPTVAHEVSVVFAGKDVISPLPRCIIYITSGKGHR